MEASLPVRPDGGSHAVGVGVVVGVHLLVGYALASGLAKELVSSVREPIEARLVEAEKKPPPPELPKPVPKKLAPPPPYVPPPEVQVAAAPPAPSITAVTPVPPPAPVEVRPEPAPAPTPAPAPPPAPAPAPPPPRVEQVAIGVACPSMVPPVLPRRAAREGIGGTVKAQATIRDGQVVNVQILAAQPSGVFENAVREAMQQYQCQTSGSREIVAVQTFEFRAVQ